MGGEIYCIDSCNSYLWALRLLQFPRTSIVARWLERINTWEPYECKRDVGLLPELSVFHSHHAALWILVGRVSLAFFPRSPGS